MAKGWVRLHREIMDHWLYQEEKVFSKLEAWMDLMLTVNHQDNKIMIDSELVTVERGSTITSVRTLCQRWKWSNTKTVKFLDTLEKDGMIIKKSDAKKTVITLINYGKYQGDDDEKTTAKRQSDDSETTQKRTNKNVKNEKNDKKNNYAEFVSLSESEYQKLVDEHGQEFTDACIRALDNYKAAKGAKYKSDYRAILNWVVEKVMDDQRKLKVISGGQTRISKQDESGNRLKKMIEEEREREKRRSDAVILGHELYLP